MNKKVLRAIMIMHGDNNMTLSKKLGISYQRLSEKINERHGAEFTQTEIFKIKQEYNLSCEDLDKIFFNEKVS